MNRIVVCDAAEGRTNAASRWGTRARHRALASDYSIEHESLSVFGARRGPTGTPGRRGVRRRSDSGERTGGVGLFVGRQRFRNGVVTDRVCAGGVKRESRAASEQALAGTWQEGGRSGARGLAKLFSFPGDLRSEIRDLSAVKGPPLKVKEANRSIARFVVK